MNPLIISYISIKTSYYFTNSCQSNQSTLNHNGLMESTRSESIVSIFTETRYRLRINSRQRKLFYIRGSNITLAIPRNKWSSSLSARLCRIKNVTWTTLFTFALRQSKKLLLIYIRFLYSALRKYYKNQFTDKKQRKSMMNFKTANKRFTILFLLNISSRYCCGDGRNWTIIRSPYDLCAYVRPSLRIRRLGP